MSRAPVYYNDSESFVCDWLENLIREKLLPEGVVDRRPIQEVEARDVQDFVQCHFFAGIGGWAYALQLAGWGDRPVWTGSCPCQPFSAAGLKRAHADERHLWPEWFRLIAECRPNTVFGEQVGAAIDDGWLDAVAEDLATAGYALGATVLGAAGLGAPHIRQRLYMVAESARSGGRRRETLARRGRSELGGPGKDFRTAVWPDHAGGSSTLAVAEVLAPSHGIPQRVGRLRAYGNAIVPQVAAAFIRAYLDVRTALHPRDNLNEVDA